jgi:hypothetical protein
MLSLISRRSAEPMPTPVLQHIPLMYAYLCQDCNCVGNCSQQCPACASRVLMGLAAVLNREVVEPIPQTQYSSQPQYVYGPKLVA